MADPHIDQFETLVYGEHACDQMKKVCLGRIPELDGMVLFAVARQEQANAAMKAALDAHPKPPAAADAAAVLEEARDTLVRFASYIQSLKGHPIPLSTFFRNENPSVVARRRLVKLAAVVAHIAGEIPKHPAITDPTWLADFTALSQKLAALKETKQGAKLLQVDLGPEVAAQREKWLAVYSANKHLLRGLFAHAGKPDLLPLVFDDLAEVHRVSGVSDDLPAEPAAGAEPQPA